MPPGGPRRAYDAKVAGSIPAGPTTGYQDADGPADVEPTGHAARRFGAAALASGSRWIRLSFDPPDWMLNCMRRDPLVGPPQHVHDLVQAPERARAY
jgi:hypothetical protein